MSTVGDQSQLEFVPLKCWSIQHGSKFSYKCNSWVALCGIMPCQPSTPSHLGNMKFKLGSKTCRRQDTETGTCLRLACLMSFLTVHFLCMGLSSVIVLTCCYLCLQNFSSLQCTSISKFCHQIKLAGTLLARTI
jgi:hypothetical protein